MQLYQSAGDSSANASMIDHHLWYFNDLVHTFSTTQKLILNSLIYRMNLMKIRKNQTSGNCVQTTKLLSKLQAVYIYV